MVVNFGVYIKLNLLQTSVNDQYLEQYSLTSLEDINLESGEYVPVGHFWKFDLEQRKKHDFGFL